VRVKGTKASSVVHEGHKCAAKPTRRPIVIPRTLASTEVDYEPVDYEAELAVVIGRDCKNAEALEYVLGRKAADNDVAGKHSTHFFLWGQLLYLKDEIPDPESLRLRCTVNDMEVQHWTTDDMICAVPQLIEFLSASQR